MAFARLCFVFRKKKKSISRKCKGAIMSKPYLLSINTSFTANLSKVDSKSTVNCLKPLLTCLTPVRDAILSACACAYARYCKEVYLYTQGIWL